MAVTVRKRCVVESYPAKETRLEVARKLTAGHGATRVFHRRVISPSQSPAESTLGRNGLRSGRRGGNRQTTPCRARWVSSSSRNLPELSGQSRGRKNRPHWLAACPRASGWQPCSDRWQSGSACSRRKRSWTRTIFPAPDRGRSACRYCRRRGMHLCRRARQTSKPSRRRRLVCRLPPTLRIVVVYETDERSRWQFDHHWP